MKFVCAVLLAAVAAAQTPSESKPAAVEGKVVNSLTGEPIRKAELTLTTSLMPDGIDNVGFDMSALGMDDFKPPEPPPKPKEPKKTYAATSDASGRFRFEGVEAGDYYLKVKHAGFVEETYRPSGALAPEGRLHLTAGQEVHDVTFRLVPQGAMSGKVVNEDGDPVSDAMVSATRSSYAGGHRTLFPGDTAQTNDRGEFRLGKLAPGRYYLVAEVMAINPMAATPPPPKDGSPETGYVATYFPRYLDVQEAEAVDVKAGADLPGFVIHMQKSRVVRVKGNAVGADGKPLKQAQVVLMSGARPASMRMASADPEGKFEIANVPPGVYTAMTVQLFGTSGGSPSMTMQTLIVPSENLSDVKLGTVPEASLAGRISVADDGKVALKGIAVTLAGGEDGPLMPASGRVEDSGAFVLKKVATARYDLSLVNLPAGAYMKSVLWNGREKLGESLDFSAGVSGDLQVILGTDGATFDAKVTRDDKPVDATVVLLPEDAGRRNGQTTHSASTDGAGHVAFKDVRPGNYLAFAWEKVEEGDWFDPAFMKAAANDGLKVTMGSRDNQHVELKAIPAAK
jgi:uncharacterized GH25 family protein